MRISVKGRYALAACLVMAEHYESKECITVVRIADTLDISKIYLEQVFSLLKRGEVVESIKGAGGGYRLKQSPQVTTVYDILSAAEISLFEETGETVAKSNPKMEKVMQENVFLPMEKALRDTLLAISLSSILEEWVKQKNLDGFMYYI